MLNIILKIFLLFFLAFLLFLVSVVIFAYPRLGQAPSKERLKSFEKSLNFKDGKFTNRIQNPILVKIEGKKKHLFPFFHIIFDLDNLKPSKALPSVKNDISSLKKEENLIIWLGHSSFYLQLDSKKILIDPVFSTYASPLPFINRAFKGKYPYKAEDFKDIDLVLFSHDHYDHIDYQTVKELKDKVKLFLVPLGVGSHLSYWGINNYLEFDWNEDFVLDENMKIHILEAQHFSGRLIRNTTLWASFLIEGKDYKIYYSGDSGYSPHFKEIGEKFPDIDLALMENGQYNERWPYSHMFPEESSQAAKDLGAKKVVMAHSGRFKISEHKWDEAYERFSQASQDKTYKLLTPKIGELYYLGDENSSFDFWWKDVE